MLLAEFASADKLLGAVDRLRALGYARLEAFTPYPIPDLDEKLQIRRSRAPWAVLASAITGGAFAYLVQWWCTVIDFPLAVGGRPIHSAPAFIPIVFETVILFG